MPLNLLTLSSLSTLSSLVALLLLCSSSAYVPPTRISPDSELWNHLKISDEARGAFVRHGLSPAQWDKLEAMARSHAMWNERINVVSRKDIENLISRHYLPSLALMNLFASSAGGPPPVVTEGLEGRTVVQLKELLRAQGLPVSGRKADLLERIVKNSGRGGSSGGGSSGGGGDSSRPSDTLAGASLLDVGTGGGFPGLPLAVACPEARFTLVDSRKKKLEVVRAIVDEFSLANVEVVHGRAEELDGGSGNGGHGGDGGGPPTFDFILGRAVTALPTFVSWVEDYLPAIRDAGVVAGGAGDTAGGVGKWGVEPGILYIKSDTNTADLIGVGLQPRDVQLTSIDDLLGVGPKGAGAAAAAAATAAAAAAAAAAGQGGGESEALPLGYSAVVNIPASRLLSAAATKARRRHQGVWGSRG